MAAFLMWRVRVRAAQALEMRMTTLKGLAIIAVLVGGTSLAVAQNGPPTGGQPHVGAGAPPGPPGPGVTHATKHHFPRYLMSATGNRHKPPALGQALPKQQ
jgi:hypothetical protein